MIVLSLFDGVSAGQLALKRLNIIVDKYYASEINKYVIQITQTNFPNTIQLGDVTKWQEWDIAWGEIDLLLAGFPCQPWSVAGKKQGDKDPRGKLFWDMLDIKNHIEKFNPNVKFLFENVKMKQDFQDYINQAIGIAPILINSSTVSAQSRKRLYWTNIPGTKKFPMFDDILEIGQPKDKGLTVKDIIEPEVDEKYYLSIDRKSTSLSALGGGRGAKTGLYLIGASRGRYIVDGKRKDIRNAPTEQKLEIRKDNKTNCLSSVEKDNRVLINIDNENYAIRRLTPTECERLQTFPDGYTEGISDNQRYKALGNSWTVDVIVHIMKGLKRDEKKKNIQQY